MDERVTRIGAYVVSVLDDLAENRGNLDSLGFSGVEFLDVLNAAPDSSHQTAITANAGLAALHPQTLLCEAELAKVLGNDPRTVRAMVRRRELPAPICLGNKAVWFAGRILKYWEEQMDRAQREAERRAVREQKLLGDAA